MRTNVTPLSLVLFGLVAGGSSALAADPDEMVGPTARCPAVSPNGQQVVFLSDSGSTPDLWIANVDGTGSRPLLVWPTSIEGCPDWHPDGSRIVFSSLPSSSQVKENIWTVTNSGASPRQLTADAGDNASPRFSPDGSSIVFTSNRTGKRELWRMDGEGGNQQAIALIPVHVSDPTWSPAGQEIAYVGCSGGYCSIYTITTDAAVSRRVTTGPYDDWHPDWSPNGIVFASNRGDAQGLWVVDPAGSQLRQLTAPAATGDVNPRWVASSASVVFSRFGLANDLAGSNVWLQEASGSARQVTSVRGFLSKGDVNTDGTVDCSDLALVKTSLGARTGQAKYSTRVDLNADGVVDIRDLALVSKSIPAGTKCS